MRSVRTIAFAGCVLALGVGAAFAGINSKEVGALLVYPEYWATNPQEPGGDGSFMETHVTITNDKSTFVRAHVEIIGGDACDDCNFDLTLTGFQTTRLRLFRAATLTGQWVTFVQGGGVSTSCPERHGFVVAALEAPFEEPRKTLGENMLHGDEVVVDIINGAASQVGAISVQGVGPNDGDRIYKFDNMEYAAFPSIVTTNFWRPEVGVDPRLILFNVNFTTGVKPTTNCSLNYVDAFERVFSRSFSFDCWSDSRLLDIAPGFGTISSQNGFLWAQCGAGTHGALMTSINVGGGPLKADFKDTLFQSVTTNGTAVLTLTPSITGTP